MKQHPLINLNDLHVHYGGVKALDGFSVQVNAGEMLVLMGPNGAGKSTVLKALFGMVPMTSGKIEIEGIKIFPKPHNMAKLGVAFVTQGRRVFPSLTVQENIEIGGHIIKSRSVLAECLEDVLGFFPVLHPMLHKKAGHLSGGQQQMVAIARALMSNPTILLLDEPSLGLAPKIVKELFETMQEINQQKHVTMIIVEHNIKTLLSIADRACILDKGRLVTEGDARKFLKTEALADVLLGKKKISISKQTLQ